jgi:hypothetical protein
MLVVALATPAAFGAEAVVFGIAYFLVRALHLVLFAIAARDDPELRRAVLRWAPGAFLGPSLLVGASFFDGSADLAQSAAALAVDYLSPQVGHGRGVAPFAGPFRGATGLIMIAALGESIVATGVGARAASRCPQDRGRAIRNGRRRVALVVVLRLSHLRLAGQAHRRHRCGAGRRSRATCTRTSTWPSAYGTGGRDRGGPR